ncbi:hypothetical protein AAG570_008960 [Ranatra chinensis]|uniref:Uncharacterized protein n=1 Tax=Ranatra chinensis TaxID=642074 RepID=A0ABD0Z9H1_9HEMI
MASKRRNMFQKNKTQETTENGSTSVSRTTRAFSSATLKTGEGMERSMRSVFEIDTEFSNYTTVSQVTYTDSQPRIIRDSGAEYPQVEGGPEDEEEEGWDMLVNPPTPPPQRKREDVLKDMRSPYQKFFLLSEEEATKWRNKDIMSSDQNEKITIQQKTKQIVNEITENFVTWAHNAGLGSDHLDVKWLNDLFQVGMENPAIKSIAVDIEELPILPDSVVAPLNLHDKSERAGLMRQVLWDVMRESGNKGLNKVAFGSYIPWRFKQAKSTRPSARERWLHNYDIPKSMLKGSDLWEKLAKTKSLERYCRWLSTKPDVMRPKYLEHSKCLSVTKKKALKLDDIYSNAIRLEGEFDHDTDSSEDEDFKCLTVWARSMNTRRGRAGVAHIFDIGHPSQYDEERFADMEAEFLSTVPKASSRMKSRRFKMLISEDDDD